MCPIQLCCCCCYCCFLSLSFLQQYDPRLDNDPEPDDDQVFDEKHRLRPQSSKPQGKYHLRHKSEDLRMLTKGLTLDSEERESKTLKPSPGASVKDKEHFVQIKYGNKGFATFPTQELLCSEKIRYDQAVDAAQTNDVQRLLRLMVWFKDEMISKWSRDLIIAAATGSLSGTVSNTLSLCWLDHYTSINGCSIRTQLPIPPLLENRMLPEKQPRIITLRLSSSLRTTTLACESPRLWKMP